MDEQIIKISGRELNNGIRGMKDDLQTLINNEKIIKQRDEKRKNTKTEIHENSN